jgi:protein-L-isoaspartate(D-aspartate) O-methyltransferase
MRDYSGLRQWMVKTQIAARGIRDERVLKVMGTVPRHLFVDEALQDQAYNDYPLPIGEGQTISQPFIVALMVEALKLKGDERVLEIGTGSGYQTAVLCGLSDKVFSIERCSALASRARKILDKLNYYNALLTVGDGTLGWKDEAPFDAIIVSASSPEIPQPLIQQLSDV